MPRVLNAATPLKDEECSGSVVECLTRDREFAGSSLIGALCCAIDQDTTKYHRHSIVVVSLQGR